jgi:general secretion pathway protein B
MSYILEALKKAEAERQLGSAPTIHAAPAVHAVPRAAARNRTPLLIGLGAGVLLASAAAFVTWRHQAAAPATLVATGRGAVQVAGAAPALAPVMVAPEPAPLASPAPALRARAPAREAHPRVPAPARPDANRPVPAAPAQDAHAPDAMRSAAPSASGTEDNVRPLAELPESIQREVPRVAFGGYIYSPNPSDRLLLVDKALRHEGEEVAPGLVLEKLLPKAAVMNYRGYRYRVAY